MKCDHAKIAQFRDLGSQTVFVLFVLMRPRLKSASRIAGDSLCIAYHSILLAAPPYNALRLWKSS